MLFVLLSLVCLDALGPSGKLLTSQLYFSLFSVSLSVKSTRDLTL